MFCKGDVNWLLSLPKFLAFRTQLSRQLPTAPTTRVSLEVTTTLRYVLLQMRLLHHREKTALPFDFHSPSQEALVDDSR